MAKSKRLKKEEALFLSLCNEKDKKMLTGQEPMSVRNFERLAYIVSLMGFKQYDIYLATVFFEQLRLLEEQIKREGEILKEYPDYYKDERVCEQREEWLDEFCQQLPTPQLQKKYRKKFNLDMEE